MPRSRESIKSDPTINKGKTNGLSEPTDWPFVDGWGIYNAVYTVSSGLKCSLIAIATVPY